MDQAEGAGSVPVVTVVFLEWKHDGTRRYDISTSQEMLCRKRAELGMASPRSCRSKTKRFGFTQVVVFGFKNFLMIMKNEINHCFDHRVFKQHEKYT